MKTLFLVAVAAILVCVSPAHADTGEHPCGRSYCVSYVSEGYQCEIEVTTTITTCVKPHTPDFRAFQTFAEDLVLTYTTDGVHDVLRMVPVTHAVK